VEAELIIVGDYSSFVPVVSDRAGNKVIPTIPRHNWVRIMMVARRTTMTGLPAMLNEAPIIYGIEIAENECERM